MKDPERTRAIILNAAFHEVHRKGFKGASLSDILACTELTKGALYHHFPNKIALGLALLDAIEERISQRWIVPLHESSDPLACLQEITRDAVETMSEEEVGLGCPLQNLAQEMSSLDEAFRIKVAALYDTWRDGIAQALAKGQKNGRVNPRIDPSGAALFYIACLSGCRGLAKNARSPEVLQSGLKSLNQYLETLRC
jgi:TetR/AcrR family transcriptional repressor of nem operon